MPCTRRSGGATSQLDLPSLKPLSLSGCGRLQLGVPHWATSVDYCKQQTIDPTFCGSRFSTGRFLAIEDFTFTFYFIRSHLYTAPAEVTLYAVGACWQHCFYQHRCHLTFAPVSQLWQRRYLSFAPVSLNFCTGVIINHYVNNLAFVRFHSNVKSLACVNALNY